MCLFVLFVLLLCSTCDAMNKKGRRRKGKAASSIDNGGEPYMFGFRTSTQHRKETRGELGHRGF